MPFPDHRPLAMLAILSASACGRIGFDPPDEPSMGGDGGPIADGAPLDGFMPDAPPSACASAVLVPFNTRVAVNTCGGMDRLAGCGALGTQEVVFKFVAPTSGGYTFRAYNLGTNNISHSIGVLDAACATVSGCNGIYGTSYTAGTVVYFTVEASGGGCAMIEFLAD